MAMLTLADCELCGRDIEGARPMGTLALELAQRVADPLLEAAGSGMMRAHGLPAARGQIPRSFEKRFVGQRRLLAGMVPIPRACRCGRA